MLAPRRKLNWGLTTVSFGCKSNHNRVDASPANDSAGNLSVNQQLQREIEQTCRHPRASVERQQGLTRIIRLVLQSGKLWREQTPEYEEALQQTCLYLCQNLCDRYRSDRASLITWLNHYLKWRLHDLRVQAQTETNQRVYPTTPDGERELDLGEILAAPPQTPPILQATRQWVETDPSGELRRLHLRGRPDVTAQKIILRRLPPEVSWKQISAELGIPIATLSAFYQRTCLPCLRKFGKSQGYL